MSTHPTSSSLDSSTVSGKRSRSGCYICKVRKVKCHESVTSSDSRSSRRQDCLNCRRLGFECRWQPPASGEGFIPPPKRRRAAPPRSDEPAVQVNAASTSPPASPDRVENPASSSIVPSGASFSPSNNRSQRQNVQVGNALGSDAASGTSNVPTEQGFALGPTFMDFNLDADGMEFIPLPVIDPSLLESFNEMPQVDLSAFWSLVPDDQVIANGDSIDDNDSNIYDDGGAENMTSPSVNEHNRQLVQHYLDVMKGYSKVDDPSKDANNLFISAFSRSLCFPPLFAAILAFSAAHLSIQDPSYIDQAAQLARAAQKSIRSFRRNHELEVEGLLSALFIQVKRIQVMGDDVSEFLALISESTEIISTAPGQRALEDPSTLTRRIILRLAILDARAACYRLGGGMLVKLLLSMAPLSDIFCGNRTPETVASPGAVASLLRANVFRMQVAELDVRLQKQLASEKIASQVLRRDEFTALFAEIEVEIKLWEARSSLLGLEPFAAQGTENRALEPASYSCSTVLSVLHSALLYLDNMFPIPRFDRAGTTAKLLHNQLRAHKDPSRRGSPSSLSPSSILLAALLTQDPIHRDWVLKITEEGQRWGRYIAKTRQLLKAVFAAQERGEEWDIRDMMDRVTGRFVI